MTEWWQGFTYGALIAWLVSVLVITVVMILITGGTRPDRAGMSARSRSGRHDVAEPAFSGSKPPPADDAAS